MYAHTVRVRAPLVRARARARAHVRVSVRVRVWCLANEAFRFAALFASSSFFFKIAAFFCRCVHI